MFAATKYNGLYKGGSIMGDNFNENLRNARMKKGYSQKEVAENIGVAKSTYSLYESGNREPSVQTIKKLADLLSVSADDLLGIDDEPHTLAAHFDGSEFTEDELDEIRQFAEFVKNKRK
jgi:transcriptional regulator with XRE-family HTH domain